MRVRHVGAVLGLMLIGLLSIGMVSRPDVKANQAPPVSWPALNVRDFGAVGDGTTDDTDALIATAAALRAQLVRVTPVGGSGEAAFPSVMFPAGVYVISAPIEWGPNAKLVADGSVIIKSTHSGQAFTFTAGYMVRMDGLTFLGGTTAIKFTNNNVNGGRLLVNDCRFQGTTDRAVLACPVTPPYFSNHVVLRGCKWFGCAQALTTWADITTVEDCWLQWSEANGPQATSCIEIIGGRLNMLDTMLVPVFPGGALGRRWVLWRGFSERNSGAGVFCDRTLFHGEFGGLPPIEIQSSPDLAYPFQGPSVVLRGCQLSCGQTSWPDCAVINCNGGIPQTVYLDGCSNVLGPCPLMRDAGGNAEAILNSLQNSSGRVRIMVGANAFYPLLPSVPGYFQPYVRSLAN
jgi:hypothetical protein